MINFLICICLSLSFAKVSRISEQEVDLRKTKLIYMTPGRSTLVDMPCEISHSLLGLDQDIKIKIGPDDKNTFTLWITGEKSEPTNLTLRCGGEVFVFDILPNKHTHQDYIQVIDYYADTLDEISYKKGPKLYQKPHKKGDILGKKEAKIVDLEQGPKTLMSSGEF